MCDIDLTTFNLNACVESTKRIVMGFYMCMYIQGQYENVQVEQTVMTSTLETLGDFL